MRLITNFKCNNTIITWKWRDQVLAFSWLIFFFFFLLLIFHLLQLIWNAVDFFFLLIFFALLRCSLLLLRNRFNWYSIFFFRYSAVKFIFFFALVFVYLNKEFLPESCNISRYFERFKNKKRNKANCRKFMRNESQFTAKNCKSQILFYFSRASVLAIAYCKWIERMNEKEKKINHSQIYSMCVQMKIQFTFIGNINNGWCFEYRDPVSQSEISHTLSVCIHKSYTRIALEL